MGGLHSDFKKLFKELEFQGWRIEKGRVHYKCYHPKGGFISVSGTSSDRYALKNVNGDINRLNKENENK